MAKIPFNVDAYTARLIGRENVSRLESAVIELIKNTYDADATCCILYYDENKDILYLADNGHGMTEDVIRTHWMTIGRSSKRGTFISNKGRIQTGEKGIGRFALDRIADKCQMLTGTDKGRLLWSVDWRIFSAGRNITEIDAELDETSISFEEFLSECTNQQVVALLKQQWDKKGTIFKLTELRESWGADLLYRIRENLVSLIPHELSTVYKIYCFNNQDTVESAEVFSDWDAFSYDYKIEFEILDATASNSKVKVKLWRSEYDFGYNEDTILKEVGLYQEKQFFHGTPIEKIYSFDEILAGTSEAVRKSAGAFSGVLYYAKQNMGSKDQERFFQKSIAGRIDVRDTFGGIKIYRDNFRVRPYGDPKTSAYDWLQLARRKNASPAGVASKGTWRVNADQMLGSIFISRMNVALPDQSNREGIVETSEFNLVQEFIKGVLEILEKDRQYVARILKEYYERAHPADSIQEEINRKAKAQKRKIRKERKSADDSMPGKEEDDNHLSDENGIDPQAAKVALDAKDEQIEELENEIKMLRILATTGIVTNTYIHEFKTLSHRLNMKIVMAKEALDKDKNMEEAGTYIEQANDIREAFNSWFQVTIDAVKKDKRKRRRMNLIPLISSAVDSWNKTLKTKHMEVIFEGKNREDICLKCFPYEIDTIINNLVTNSTASFDKKRTKEKKIYIDIKEEGEYIRIDYSDTGIGLDQMYKKEPNKILEVFETDKRDSTGQKIGTGMGLWIVNNTIQDYKGKIDLSKNVTEKTGFYVSLFLKKVGEVKNV